MLHFAFKNLNMSLVLKISSIVTSKLKKYEYINGILRKHGNKLKHRKLFLAEEFW